MNWCCIYAFAILLLDGVLSRKTSVVLFKLPRTGSSWLTDLLNGYPNVFLSKEILQHSSRGAFDNEVVEAHLRKALMSPMDKLRPSSRIGPITLPQSRYMNTYYYSGYLGKLLHDTCGVSNIPKTRLRHCTSMMNLPNTTIPWSARQFCSVINHWQIRISKFRSMIETKVLSVARNKGIKVAVKEVYYEDLQAAPTMIVQGLMNFLNPRKGWYVGADVEAVSDGGGEGVAGSVDSSGKGVAGSAASGGKDGSSWTKRSSESLVKHFEFSLHVKHITRLLGKNHDMFPGTSTGPGSHAVFHEGSNRNRQWNNSVSTASGSCDCLYEQWIAQSTAAPPCSVVVHNCLDTGTTITNEESGQWQWQCGYEV